MGGDGKMICNHQRPRSIAVNRETMHLKPTAIGLTADQTDMQFLHPVSAHGDAGQRTAPSHLKPAGNANAIRDIWLDKPLI